ncbi:hypothetical protein GBL_1860 [Geobacillus kaustophilus GBlys]|uniref:Uncharacterized protein n=1 Tax=Geobacillus kaustophilus GBlys TaxID=1337888 RepID=U2YA00_GEOKU|nr:hypothetical protein GBL_1860 [Geobacillus kaustophilus GBlys]
MFKPIDAIIHPYNILFGRHLIPYLPQLIEKALHPFIHCFTPFPIRFPLYHHPSTSFYHFLCQSTRQ